MCWRRDRAQINVLLIVQWRGLLSSTWGRKEASRVGHRFLSADSIVVRHRHGRPKGGVSKVTIIFLFNSPPVKQCQLLHEFHPAVVEQLWMSDKKSSVVTFDCITVL